MPRMPSVLPWISAPSMVLNDHWPHCPSRSQRSDSVMRRAVAINSAKPRSAVVSVSTSGVLLARMPAALKASMSRLL